MKRSYLIIFILILLFSWNDTNQVMAATGITKAEQLILDKMKAGVEFNEEMKYLPISYANQAENEFISNKVDITEEQAELIIQKMDEAIRIMNDSGMSDITNMQSSEVLFSLLTLVSEVADEVNYEVAIDIANRSVNIKNPEGDTVFIAKNTVNQTGYRVSSMSWLSGILSILLMSSISVVIILVTGRRDRCLLSNAIARTRAFGKKHEE